jgi:two-component system, response regulator YesN
MSDLFDAIDSAPVPPSPHTAGLLWVNLTRQTHTALGPSMGEAFHARCVGGLTQIPAAIQVHAPKFLCFEFDEPDAAGMAALTHTRCEHPDLPILLITGRQSEALVLWARRARVWNLLVKPVSHRQLDQCIQALIELTRGSGPEPAHATRLSLQGMEVPATPGRQGSSTKTYPAILHVTSHFEHRIALNEAAALCRLSPSQFCRVFRQEQGLSFAQHLLHYRLERACEGLAQPGALAKQVAYSVGFNDLSYFSRAFKRHTGVRPSDYQAGAQ